MYHSNKIFKFRDDHVVFENLHDERRVLCNAPAKGRNDMHGVGVNCTIENKNTESGGQVPPVDPSGNFRPLLKIEVHM